MSQELQSNFTPDTLVTYQDGKSVFESFKKRGFIIHNTGMFILAPSGTGKTYFISKQSSKDWIDGDELWPITGADFSSDEWNEDMAQVMEINARSDIITLQAKKHGLWVLGSSNLFLKPDAIVLPAWEKHQQYIKTREQNKYGDGATTDDLDGVLAHREWISKWSKYGVPVFQSVDEAAKYCAGLSETNNEIISNL